MDKNKLLSILELHPNGITSSELASQYGETVASLSMDLRRLCQKNLAVRQRITNYPPQYVYSISPSGRRLLEEEAERAKMTAQKVPEGQRVDLFLLLGGMTLLGLLGYLAATPDAWERVKSFFPGQPEKGEKPGEVKGKQV